MNEIIRLNCQNIKYINQDEIDHSRKEKKKKIYRKINETADEGIKETGNYYL